MLPQRRSWALGSAGSLTGGALAKLKVKTGFGDGWVELLAILSAIGDYTLLMLHFLHRLLASASPDPSVSAPVGWVLSWMFVFVAALVAPWMPCIPATGIGTPMRTPAGDSLGGVMAYLIGADWRSDSGAGDDICRGTGRRRRGRGQPVMRVVVRRAEALERVEGVLRQWPVAGLSLLMLSLILGGGCSMDIDSAIQPSKSMT